MDPGLFRSDRRKLRKHAAKRGKARAAMSMLSLLVFLIVSGCGGKPAETADSLASFSKHLDEQVPRWMDHYGVPGVSMALVIDGELAWTGAYGFADLGHGQKMTVDAVCRAESISKSVTAWGVMRLVEQGLVDLDVPVQEYLGGWQLPETDYDEREVTVRRLLSASAGMSLLVLAILLIVTALFPRFEGRKTVVSK